MKILFLNGQYPFCYYYRGYIPGVYSGQMVVKDFLTQTKYSNIQNVLDKAEKADVVVIQRPNSKESLNVIKALKAKGKKVIFENDDTYLYGEGIDPSLLENDSQRAIAKEMSDITNRCLALCDGAIASTEFLAEEYRKINKNVCILKNCIDPLDEFPTKKQTGKFRIGLIGSVTTNDDYIHIKDDIRKLDERDDVTIVVFGVKHKDGTNAKIMDSDREFWDSLKNVEWQSYVPVTEYMLTLSRLNIDLALIPRKDSYFNRCKSNLKFLELSLLKIPVIAQDFEGNPYENDRDYLTLLKSGESWYNTVITVKENYKTYLDKAEKAHDYVLEHYNINNYAQEWVKSIEKLCKFQQNY